MKTENQHGYVIMGYRITLKQVIKNTPIKVIPGKGKKLYLKLGEETGLTNAVTIEDELRCFIPDKKGNSSLIMKIILDYFNLEIRNGTIKTNDSIGYLLNEEFMVQLHLNVLNKYEAEYKGQDLKFVIEFCHLSKNSEETQTPYKDSGNFNYRTHFIVKGFNISIQDVIEQTDVFVNENEQGRICFQMGPNKAITNAKNIKDNLFYVTAMEGSDVEEIMYKIAVAFMINVIRIKIPIASTSDKVVFDDEFFSTYGNAIVKDLKEDKVILSMRTVFTGEPEPGYVSIPVDFLGFND